MFEDIISIAAWPERCKREESEEQQQIAARFGSGNRRGRVRTLPEHLSWGGDVPDDTRPTKTKSDVGDCVGRRWRREERSREIAQSAVLKYYLAALLDGRSCECRSIQVETQ